MQTLHLSNNGMKSLPPSLFKMCLQLSTLNLHGPEITMDILRQGSEIPLGKLKNASASAGVSDILLIWEKLPRLDLVMSLNILTKKGESSTMIKKKDLIGIMRPTISPLPCFKN
ncbi:hypothetical protein ACS0TY_001006 [Phlomoides rotata]